MKDKIYDALVFYWGLDDLTEEQQDMAMKQLISDSEDILDTIADALKEVRYDLMYK